MALYGLEPGVVYFAMMAAPGLPLLQLMDWYRIMLSVWPSLRIVQYGSVPMVLVCPVLMVTPGQHTLRLAH